MKCKTCGKEIKEDEDCGGDCVKCATEKEEQ
jgi:hypothetical protein